jgi:gliding motility-associated lipoprotein GldH
MIFKIKNKPSYCPLPIAYYPLPITHCLLLIAYCLLPSSCTQLDTFEKNTSIPDYLWQSSFEAKGTFAITDTATTYNAYIVLRHTDAYKYNNIWLSVGIQPPADTLHYQKADLQLGTDAKGWAGTGMNDIWEQRQLLFTGRQFKRPGIYNFSIKQIMRDDPLPAVMSAGLRVEKQ